MFPQNINGFASQIKSEMNFQNNSKINVFRALFAHRRNPTKYKALWRNWPSLAAVRRNTNQCQSAHTRGRCTMNAGMIKQQGAILYLVLPTYTEQKLIPWTRKHSYSLAFHGSKWSTRSSTFYIQNQSNHKKWSLTKINFIAKFKASKW